MGSAPTDDENGRLSRLELANGGTLFLEKIEYLAPELQSALLQVIKQGVLTRLDARRLNPGGCEGDCHHHRRSGQSGGTEPL